MRLIALICDGILQWETDLGKVRVNQDNFSTDNASEVAVQQKWHFAADPF